MTAALTVLGACWAVGAVAAAFAIGRAIRHADETACPRARMVTCDDQSWLDDQPFEALSRADQVRVCERMWAR